MRIADAAGWCGVIASLASLAALVPAPWIGAFPLALGVLGTATIGIGHGALDHDLPRMLRGASRATSVRIAAAYLAVLAAGFAAFCAAPPLMLYAFIALSLYHFALGDADFARRYVTAASARMSRPGSAWLAGALPFVVPALAHPAAVAAGFAAVLAPLPAQLPAALAVSAPAALGAIGLLVAVESARRLRLPLQGGSAWWALELPAAFAAFIAAPPLTAFLLYFAFWHALRHVVVLADAAGYDVRAPWPALASVAAGMTAKLTPMTLGAFGILLAGAALSRGRIPLPAVVIGLTFATTVPHVACVAFLRRTLSAKSA